MKLYRKVVLIFTGVILTFVSGACSMSSSTPKSSLQAACAAVKNKDVAAYKKGMYSKQLKGMEELAELTEELGLYDDPK